MKTRTRITLALLGLVMTMAVPLAAEGAGGSFFGLVEPGWNPSFMPAASTPEMEYMGGYGYGVTYDGFIIGGFGLAFLDYDIYDKAKWSATGAVPIHVAGGVGGVILGQRILGWESFHLDVAARLGVGGMGVSTRQGSPGSYYYVDSGYAIVYAEPYIEAGVGLVPWMHLSATFGYTLIGNFIPGRPMTDALFYTPTLGITMSFGSFERPW
jgi:hypothetical protein